MERAPTSSPGTRRSTPRARSSRRFTRSRTTARIWEKLDEGEVKKLRHETLSWTLSQFMHGEQGALLATSQIVDAVPWIDAKFYAATQVDGRGAPRRGVRPLPAREARVAVPDQRAPAHAARRDPHRRALGHEVPRHADHGRRARDGGVRLHAPDARRAAARRSSSTTSCGTSRATSRSACSR